MSENDRDLLDLVRQRWQKTPTDAMQACLDVTYLLDLVERLGVQLRQSRQRIHRLHEAINCYRAEKSRKVADGNGWEE